MKLKAAVSIVITALASLLLFSSCDSIDFFRSAESLLMPPLYFSEYEDLIDAFNSSVGSTVTLCNPKDGDYLSAITVSDIDSDGEEEGIVFYRDALEGNTASFSVFKNYKGNWKKCGDYRGYGDGVDSMLISDLDGDNMAELVVIWSFSGISNADIFSVYRSGTSAVRYTEISKESCDIAKVFDIDGDGEEEIFYITSEMENDVVKKFARIMKFTGQNLEILGETKVDPNVGGYVSFKREKDNISGNTKVYLDATKSGDMMITEVLYWNDYLQVLLAPLFDEESNSNTASLRYEPIPCSDINGDGRIEIPVQTVYKKSGEDDNQDVYLTEWTDFEGNKKTDIIKSLVNVSEDYYIDLDELKIKDPGLSKYVGTDWTAWIIYDPVAYEKTGNALFTVLKIPRDRWESENHSKDIIIISRLDSIICVNINRDGAETGLDGETIKNIVKKLP